MSPTTQRHEHSPYRRRKSMSFRGPRNIKVIVFRSNVVCPTYAVVADGKPAREIRGSWAAAIYRTRCDDRDYPCELCFGVSIKPGFKLAMPQRYEAAFHPASAELHLCS